MCRDCANKGIRSFMNLFNANMYSLDPAGSVLFVPVLEEASKAEGHQLQRGFNHKGGGEEVVAVLQRGLQRLGLNRDKTGDRRKKQQKQFSLSPALILKNYVLS